MAKAEISSPNFIFNVLLCHFIVKIHAVLSEIFSSKLIFPRSEKLYPTLLLTRV